MAGREIISVEGVRAKSQIPNPKSQIKNVETAPALHPVQQAMVECNGSQCGYCTPGIIMSMFALYKNENEPAKESIEDALTGNLCRCTGYKPIIEATAKSCVNKGADHFTQNEKQIIE